MAQWSKVKFYYDTMLGSAGSTLTADSTETAGDYSVDYICNMLEGNSWNSADSSSPQHVTYDAGAGNGYGADYLAVSGHNLGSIGATIVLQYSTDGFVADINDAFTAFAPGSDNVLLKEFANPGAYRYWRLRITGATLPPVLPVCIWGLSTELDYASNGFDPHAEETMATVNVSRAGYVTGVHSMYSERRFTLRFEDADPALYAKVRTWHETSGLKNFFVAWELANNPGEVYLLRPDANFNNPMKGGGAYRDITINLKGRKEQ